MKKKLPLEGLSIAPISAEEVKRLLEEGRKNVEAAEKKRNEPPETPTGKCVFCGGLVKGVHVHGLHPGTDSRFVPIGPGGRQYYGWQFKGYHCTSCGLSYKFPPPEGIVTRQGDADEAGRPAQVDQGRGRAGARRGRKGKPGSPEDV